MKLSIVICCYNKWNYTKSCLNDLAQLPGDHELIIIDNASSDETNVEINFLFESLQQKYPEGCKLNYYRNSENTFHSEACNKGYAKAKSDNVLFLNNDIRVKSNHTDWTQEIIKNCDKAIVGPTMGLLDNDLNFVKEANQQLDGNSYLSGWCVASSKKNWNKLSPNGKIWNEDYPFYFNDTDLSFRARQSNIPLQVISIPMVVHFGKVSAAQINVHKLYTEGRKVFVKQWAK